MVHYRILFIVNPISGFGLGWEIPYRIRHIAAYKHIEYNIRFTEYAGHAKEIVEQLLPFSRRETDSTAYGPVNLEAVLQDDTKMVSMILPSMACTALEQRLSNT